MTQIIHDIDIMHRKAEELRASGMRIGLVPTMGALHEGHRSLIRRACDDADIVVTSVFVNPTQFGRGEDFDRYPRDLDADVHKATGAGTDIVFAPTSSHMYPQGYGTFVLVEQVTDRLEGAARPGHFRGVATVVLKLVNIVRPHVAVFGQKDAQQVVVIRKMLQDLNSLVDLVVAPTVREPDGLAMSSRNGYLSPESRKEAPALFRALQRAKQRVRDGIHSADQIIAEMQSMIHSQSTGVIDYISVADANTLEELDTVTSGRQILVSLAVRFGATRLIDNFTLTG